ncbi:glycosyltransferase family 2 protein [Spirosoma sp. SC4-14]|uniref:glycosyltransferase family 2 protein n=1 Tax=Spirosoma sp. SC4-14 TaxID=3128900 RepID=UPI0030CCCF0A
MEQQQYTVIIPTRERADTLLHALRTCTSQDYDKLTILVSDNFSQDNTREVVESFDDSRIRYVNTGQRLSMSHNWEFALSQASDQGFVTYLGDDDGLLPNSVRDTDDIIQATGLKAVNMNPAPDFYLWPSYFNRQQANFMKVSFQRGTIIKQGKDELNRVLTCREDYLKLPFIYNSFVSMEAVNQVKRITKTFFRSQIPDIYSGIALANTIGPYVLSNRRLRLSGASSHSTGMSQFNYNTNSKSMDTFASEPNIPFHQALRYCPSYSYLIAESFMQSFDAGLNADEQLAFNWLPFIRTAIKEANTKFLPQRDSIISATRHIADVNHLDTEQIERLINGSRSRLSNIILYDLQRYAYPFLLINAADYGVTNIYEACQLYRTVYENPAKFWLNSSTWIKMKQMLFGELSARYSSVN